MYCIAGADGFFGAYIQRYLINAGESVLALNHGEAVFPDSPLVENRRFELTSAGDLRALADRLRKADDIRVIYLIAAHAPDFVKANPERAFYINSEAYRDFLTALSSCAVTKLYYASSDTVYGENRGEAPFTEDMPPAPINLYGEHKAEAERITLENGFSAVRFSYMFAPSLTHKKHFFDTLTDKLQNGEPIRMFTDYIRSSLLYSDAAEYLCRLAASGSDERIVNICGDDPTSKYDIGLYAAKRVGADRRLVVPCLSTETGVFTERRAGTLTMSNGKLKKILGTDAPITF